MPLQCLCTDSSTLLLTYLLLVHFVVKLRLKNHHLGVIYPNPNRLVYRSVHGLAPHYLSDYFKHVAYSNRRRLRSSSSSLLLIPRTRLITVGDGAFPVAGSRLWNGLPHVVTSAPTLAVFRQRLKTYLFSRSFTL